MQQPAIEGQVLARHGVRHVDARTDARRHRCSCRHRASHCSSHSCRHCRAAAALRAAAATATTASAAAAAATATTASAATAATACAAVPIAVAPVPIAAVLPIAVPIAAIIIRAEAAPMMIGGDGKHDGGRARAAHITHLVGGAIVVSTAAVSIVPPT